MAHLLQYLGAHAIQIINLFNIAAVDPSQLFCECQRVRIALCLTPGTGWGLTGSLITSGLCQVFRHVSFMQIMDGK